MVIVKAFSAVAMSKLSRGGHPTKGVCVVALYSFVVLSNTPPHHV